MHGHVCTSGREGSVFWGGEVSILLGGGAWVGRSLCDGGQSSQCGDCDKMGPGKGSLKQGPGGSGVQGFKTGVGRERGTRREVTWQVSILPSGYPAHALVERMRPLYHWVELHKSRSMRFTRASCSVGAIL